MLPEYKDKSELPAFKILVLVGTVIILVFFVTFLSFAFVDHYNIMAWDFLINILQTGALALILVILLEKKEGSD